MTSSYDYTTSAYDRRKSSYSRKRASNDIRIDAQPAKRVSYKPPVSSDPFDNNEYLVETFPIQQKEDYGIETAPGPRGTPGLHCAWTSKQQTFENGDIQTELLVINAAENFTFNGDKSLVTLYCQREALDEKHGHNPQRISWL